MASIDSTIFDKPAYNPGDTVSLTVDYTPDTPSVVPTTFTATVTLADGAGAAVATAQAPFVVNVAQPAGDTVSAADDGNRAWTRSSDTGTVAVLTATA
jgi:hypothetical protein